MLTDVDITFTSGNDGITGVALVWVIDGNCLYDVPTWKEYEDMFISSDEVVDISESYPEHDGLTVRFVKNGQTVGELKTSEYFGSILLSSPTVLRLGDYPYGRYVISPNATFDGKQFNITDRDVSSYYPWHRGHVASNE